MPCWCGLRCSWSGSIFYSSCKSGVFVSYVNPVAVLNAFCIV